jgi:hypothetical protein
MPLIACLLISLDAASATTEVAVLVSALNMKRVQAPSNENHVRAYQLVIHAIQDRLGNTHI